MLKGSKIVEWDGLRFDVSMVSPNVQSRMKRHRYEGQSIDRLKALCPADTPFVNFGGGMGIVDCLHNAQMKNPDEHVSVEGNPENVAISDLNREANGCRYTTINKAIAYTPEVSFFVPDQSTELMMAGSIDNRFSDIGINGKRVTVETITLGEILKNRGWKNVALVVDIEGGEYDLVEKEIDTMVECCDWLLIEWHFGRAPDDRYRKRATRCKQLLKARMNFDKENSSSAMSILKRRPTVMKKIEAGLRSRLPKLFPQGA